MKGVLAISAVIAIASFVAILGYNPGVDSTFGSATPALPPAAHPMRKSSADGALRGAAFETSPAPVALRMKNASGDTAPQMLVDIIRRAALSGDASLWQQVANDELLRLIDSDPLAAADLAQSLDSGPVREGILRRVAHGWADQNAKAALAWAAGLADAVERNSAVADVCIQMSQSNPAEAIEVASKFGLEDQGARFENLVQQWASQDFTAAYGWVSQLPAGAERDGSMARLALIAAQVSPADAASLVATEIPPGTVQSEAAISVLHQWGMQDFAAASAWANQFPDGLFADRAKQELASISIYR